MTTTTNYNLNKPVKGQSGWDVQINENMDIVDEILGSHESQLAENQTQLSNLNTSKANKIDVNTSLTLKRDKSTQITMNDIAQDVKTAMTGGSVAVVGANAVNSVNIQNKSTTNEKLSDDIISKFGYTIKLGKSDFTVGKAYVSALSNNNYTMCNETVLDVSNIDTLYAYQNSGYYAVVMVTEFNDDGSFKQNDGWITNFPNGLITAFDVHNYKKIILTVCLSTTSSSDNWIVFPSSYFTFDLRFYPNGLINDDVNFSNIVENGENILNLQENILDSQIIYRKGDFTVGKAYVSSLSDNSTTMCNLIPFDVSEKKSVYIYQDSGYYAHIMIACFDASSNYVSNAGWVATAKNKVLTKIDVSAYSKIIFTIGLSSDGNHDNRITFPTNYFKCNFKYYNDVPKTVNVSKDGTGDYTTILDAILNSIDDDVIMIKSGKYEENISCRDYKVHLVGTSKSGCVLFNNTGAYETNPLDFGKGSVSNLTVIADNSNGTILENTQTLKPYALHLDSNTSAGEEITFDNCVFISKLNAALGMGGRPNCKYKFNNCEFISTYNQVWHPDDGGFTTLGAVFFHDSADSNYYGGNQNIEFNNCRMESANDKVLYMMGSFIVNNALNVTYNNNKLWSDTVGKSNVIKTTTPSGTAIAGSTIFLKGDSFGNNIDSLNAS